MTERNFQIREIPVFIVKEGRVVKATTEAGDFAIGSLEKKKWVLS